MTTAIVNILRPSRNLMPLIPDSDLSRLVAEAYGLAQIEPGILEMIDRDRDACAMQKKKLRIEDRDWLNSRGASLPGFDMNVDEDWAEDLELNIGRPRMPAILVLIFIVIRGYWGGFKDRKTVTMLIESKTLESVLINLGLRLPGASTIIENVNAVTAPTLELILDAQVRQAQRQGLDDFTNLTVDSTGVEANSSWPTDSGTIAGLAARAERLLRELSDFGIALKIPAIVKKLIADIEIMHKQIQLSSGKKDSAAKRKKFYRKLFKYARKVKQLLSAAFERGDVKARRLDVMPSLRNRLMTNLEWIKVDLHNLALAIDNASRRILRDEKVPADQKVLSLSDQDASMIVKGGREPILGYKPQIARSGNGMIVGLVVPEGNAADSGQLRTIVDASIKRTGVTPSTLSLDDGYTNAEDRIHYLGAGIDVVSFSGSKGKRLIPAAEYDSAAYQQARNARSAVESLMFTLKHNFDFDRMQRRGIEGVRSEMLEKALVHNFFRLINLRIRQTKRVAA